MVLSEMKRRISMLWRAFVNNGCTLNGGSGGGSGTVTSVTAGAGLSGGTITTSGTISMPNIGTPNTYGDSTHFPVITTDSKGRVTGITLEEIVIPTLTVQYEKFTLDSSGAASLTVTITPGLIADESKYDVYLGGVKQYASEGDFTYSSGTITFSGGSLEENSKGSILIKE